MNEWMNEWMYDELWIKLSSEETFPGKRHDIFIYNIPNYLLISISVKTTKILGGNEKRGRERERKKQKEPVLPPFPPSPDCT